MFSTDAREPRSTGELRTRCADPEDYARLYYLPFFIELSSKGHVETFS